MLNKEKLRDNLWNIIFFVLLFTLAIVILGLLVSVSGKKNEDKNLVGALFIGSVNDNGWNETHYLGLKAACDETGCPLKLKEYVKENYKDSKEAIDELVGKGCSIIFLTSDGYGSELYQIFDEYPQIMFYTISPESDRDNVTTYYGRMYQMRYLSGIIAGKMTESNILGYVAAMDNGQVDRGINAYLLGARSVNPNAVVRVKMVGAWYDREKEKKLAGELIEEGADVLTYHSSTDDTVQVAEEKGVYSIGYNDLETAYSENNLATIVFHWDVLYRAIIRDFMRGEIGKNDSYWWGATEGAVNIEKLSSLISGETLSQMGEARNMFDEGSDVFVGRIVRNDGKVMCRKDERMGDEALLMDMNWFVEGVEVDAD